MPKQASVSVQANHNGHKDGPQWCNYGQAEIIGFTEPARVASVDKGPVADEPTRVQNVEVAHTGTETAAPKIQKLCSTVNAFATIGESLAFLSKAQVEFRAQLLLRKCDTARQEYVIALQHFDVHNQFFVSACASKLPDQTKDILATLHELRRAGDELFAPQDNYILCITKYRLFLANLLDRLPIINPVRAHITAGFNALSVEYEQKENAVREAIGNIFVQVGGNAGEKLTLYMKVFRERGEMLKAHQTTMEKWVKEAMTELPEGYLEFEMDSESTASVYS